MGALLSTESFIRLAAFGGILAAMVVWELLAPRRDQKIGRSARWPSNIGVVVLDTLLVRLVFPVGAVGLALLAEAQGWGLFNAFGVPAWAAIPLGVILLDLAIYLQHVLFHAVPALWRLHRMHHADREFDVTTGIRFDPIEILLSMGIKLGVVVALGTPALAVLIFEILLNATSMFNHGNVRIPRPLDRGLRLLVVTPEMHRVHHSVIPTETNSNFGFNLPWWDYLLGTYRSQPADGHERMQIGLRHLRDEQQVERLPGMLALPFVGAAREYPTCGRAEEMSERR
jgi:sterol desaturase/sphingolipid hydroxylase (fatty acid hydroxylase superfamily)